MLLGRLVKNGDEECNYGYGADGAEEFAGEFAERPYGAIRQAEPALDQYLWHEPDGDDRPGEHYAEVRLSRPDEDDAEAA